MANSRPLWKELDIQKRTAHELFSGGPWARDTTCARALLAGDREEVVQFLRTKLAGSDREKGWAVVLLAKMHSFEMVELRRLLDEELPNPRQSDLAEDLAHAMLLLDPAAAIGQLKTAAGLHVLHEWRDRNIMQEIDW
jgi:hypothetical protein